MTVVSPPDLLAGLLAAAGRRDRLRHVEHVPAAAGRTARWPQWADPDLVAAWQARGIEAPWAHQASAAGLAHDGRSVVIATGTASGKSLAYQLPVLTAVLAGARAPDGRGATALYLAPTKALAHDQLRSIADLGLPGLRVAAYDGDTATEDRSWIRAHAGVVLTNPDLVHHALLPGHPAWAGFLRALRYVVVDECHVYRGVFGSHVAAVLRRLRRVAAHYGADPVVICASATVADAAATATRLTGLPMTAVDTDTAPRGPVQFALWEPPMTPFVGEHGAPVRRSATAETAELLADLVSGGVRTLAFVRSRRGAETVAVATRDKLGAVDAALADRVAAYRAGFLPEERRALEHRLRSGQLLGLATTSALELGVDVHGLDAVLLAGWPGTRASLWQRAGRAGRDGSAALVIFVAGDDPLDSYLVGNPAAIFGAPVEATVLDPDNPYVLGPHLAAAAAEQPLTGDDLPRWFGPAAAGVADDLVERGVLRRRPAGLFWTHRERASALADLRGTGGAAIQVVEAATGGLLGTVDQAAAHTTVHAGAVYVHQGRTYLVEQLDLDAGVALVAPAVVDHSTHARQVSDIRILRCEEERSWGDAVVCFGEVQVTSAVVSYLRRRLLTGEVLGEEALQLPPRHLHTRAVWWTVTAAQLDAAGLTEADVAGAAHAAEHASIGLLPLVATCDRWDIGGVSTALHPDTGACTVFVYDGHPGGAGFAERGFLAARAWLTATRDAVAGCACPAGCPSCVQSPKCGNGNEPLDKSGASRLLAELVRHADADAPNG